MFTLEESALLRRLLYLVAWVIVALLVGGCWATVRWIHHHRANAPVSRSA